LNSYNSIIILGPTASGKTKLAISAANEIHGAIISFDSRQVYRQLNIGAGKDLMEYDTKGGAIPYYLINICDIGTHLHNYEFILNYIDAFKEIENKNLLPIICGGTGLYFDLALKKMQLINIPVNESLRKNLENIPIENLSALLAEYPYDFRKNADTSTIKRCIRAIEIADFLSGNPQQIISYPELNPLIAGLRLTAPERRVKIEERLLYRLNNGLIEEVSDLLNSGIPKERLIYLGLEYKYITEYLIGEYHKDEMIYRLKHSIFQYAKRQMTWFRKMEREGHEILWIDATTGLNHQLEILLTKFQNHNQTIS